MAGVAMIEKRKVKYNTNLTGSPFLFFEMKNTARLILDGHSDEMIKEIIIDSNIFQYKTKKSLHIRISEVLKRLSFLNNDLLNIIAYSDSDEAKIVGLYTILKSDRLFFEFFKEIIWDRITHNFITLKDADFNYFFESKAEQSPKIAKWKPRTIKQLKNVYKRILKEVGIINNFKSIKLKSPMISDKVLHLIYNSGDSFFADFLAGGHFEKRY